MSIQAVIFDLGGVILRTEDPRPRQELAERLGMTYAELDQAVFGNALSHAAERGEAEPEQVWAEAARLLALPAEEIPAFRQSFFGGDRVDFDLVAFIAGLRPRYKTGLLSNTWTVDLPGWLRDGLNILPETFDVIVSSARSKMRKPDPRVFALALEALQVRPEQAVFVDDFAHNTQAAAALGMHVVHFRGPEQARQELAVLLGLGGLPE